MARIAGIDLPKNKRIDIALSYIYGVGRPLANKILQSASVERSKRVKDLTEEEISRVAAVLQASYKIEGDLKRDVSQNIKRLMDIGSYRGIRHKKGLPVRGQRTSTNARTRKGPKRTVGVQRKGKTKVSEEKE